MSEKSRSKMNHEKQHSCSHVSPFCILNNLCHSRLSPAMFCDYHQSLVELITYTSCFCLNEKYKTPYPHHNRGL